MQHYRLIDENENDLSEKNGPTEGKDSSPMNEEPIGGKIQPYEAVNSTNQGDGRKLILGHS